MLFSKSVECSIRYHRLTESLLESTTISSTLPSTEAQLVNLFQFNCFTAGCSIHCQRTVGKNKRNSWAGEMRQWVNFVFGEGEKVTNI